MQDFLDRYDFMLSEAAIVERLRRRGDIALDNIVHAHLIYDAQGAKVLSQIYNDYIRIAQQADTPLLLCTPTWRTNKDRVQQSGISTAINRDAARFLHTLKQRANDTGTLKIGGTIGCRNDCYRPEEGLSATEATRFHTWQIEQLATGEVDFLIAVTLPSVEEALGIANAMAMTGKPYIISFVIGRDGKLLDGHSLADAFDIIDSQATTPPLGYFVNCSYPAFLNPSAQPAAVFKRLLGMQANASSLDHTALDGSPELKSEPVEAWGDLMLQLNRDYGVKVLGGCCGTGNEHLEYLVNHGR
ncbi:homocysteine S-methyltransferase family protein [Kistimonas asteriae]|uniref:homocysteine S-methyltransferase family protein n=1 Tax=Kistimonas asteriae TaxID=517724 RepID=UPI001BADFB21|nr:homocysteine S-methyltransferase family protein [Kistimonas asteriae]